jgi:hypothetical protein
MSAVILLTLASLLLITGLTTRDDGAALGYIILALTLAWLATP